MERIVFVLAKEDKWYKDYSVEVDGVKKDGWLLRYDKFEKGYTLYEDVYEYEDGYKYKTAEDIAVGRTMAGVRQDMYFKELVKRKPKGGTREGAGRKSKGYKMVSIRMTEEEKIKVKEFLKKLRSASL